MPNPPEPPAPSRRAVLKATALTAAGLSFPAAACGDEPAALGPMPDRLEALVRDHEAIQRARGVGLAVLNPSRRDLERGLELHRSALVFDAYAFAPRAAVDGAALARAVEAGASDVEVQDLTEDMGMTRGLTDAREREEWQTALAAAGVTCIFQNAGEECQHPLRLLKRLARFTYVTDLLKPVLTKAATPADIEAAKRAGRPCLYLTGNGVPLPQDWNSVEEELRYVRVFFQLGIRMMHLTYQRRNMLGDGCAESADAGLSDFGRHAIAEMNRQGVIVDVAHSGWRTSREAARASARPCVASHTAAAGLHRHIRGKPDDVLTALADSGGVAGVCCIPAFLGGRGDLAAFLDHIDYIVKKVGVDHVAIGTDVAHTSRHDAAERRRVPARRRTRNRFANFWPQGALGGGPAGRESLAWTNWPLFTVGLVQRDYRDEEIRKILGGNMLRVARAAFPAIPPL